MINEFQHQPGIQVKVSREGGRYINQAEQVLS